MKKFLIKFLHSKSKNEDIKRREFILNILLFSTIAIFAFATVVNIFVSIYRPFSYEKSSVSLLFVVIFLLLFLLLYFLSKKGYSKLSAYIFTILLFSLALYMGIKWGIDVNISLLLYALLIVMTSVLIGTKSSFIFTGIIITSTIFIEFLHKAEIVIPNTYWRNEPWKESDTLMLAIILLSIATVSWLSNHETEKSLTRARRSEKMLKEERDKLEITVEERTKELREVEAEKISQLYRFAEFGRLSSGLFHDLMNPLGAVSLNVEKAKIERGKKGNLEEVKNYLDKALFAAKKMEFFVSAIQKQLTKKSDKKIFSLEKSVNEIIDILSYKSHIMGVKMCFEAKSSPKFYGEEMRWNQVVLNLLTNAIDSYEEKRG